MRRRLNDFDSVAGRVERESQHRLIECARGAVHGASGCFDGGDGRRDVRHAESLRLHCGHFAGKIVERLVGPTRYRQGVVVAARSSTLRISSDALQVRDIIYQVNGQQVTDVKSLREVLKGIPDGSPLVLQIERDHNLHYVPVGAAGL
jgi:hypothetical protein